MTQKTPTRKTFSGEKLVTERTKTGKQLLAEIAKNPHIKRLKKAVATCPPSSGVLLQGVSSSFPSLLFSSLYDEESFLLIAENEESAGYLHSDLSFFIDRNRLAYFPSAYRRSIRYGQRDEAQEVMRTELLASLTAGEEPLIVTYPEALMEVLPYKEQLNERLFPIRSGERIDLVALRSFLAEYHFEEVDYVYQPGEVAFRGSIIDIFPFNSERPIRVDLFDDEVESIRSFDIATQLSIKELEETYIAPNLNRLNEKHGASLLELLPATYKVALADWDFTLGQFKKLFQEEAVVVENEGFESSEAMRKELLSPERLVQSLMARSLVYMQAGSHSATSQVIAFHTAPQPLYQKNFQLLAESLERLAREGVKTYFLSESDPQAERLYEILQAQNLQVPYPKRLPITLHQGFKSEELKIAFITDHQLFERYHKYRLSGRRIKNSQAAVTLKEIRSFSPGDYLVHYDHGIGRFAGLVRTTIGDVEQEVIKLIYEGGDYIYVNLHSLHKLSKYRAKDDGEPQLSKLGGGAWERLKERTKKKVKDIARDLIKLYAARKESKGFSFSADSYLQHELEASFCYEETPDQLAAMEAVKQDMESQRPMDRLICGDVGFGKTEVAMRAAFKAVADSKQVAVLVPTTLLAYQHFTTFSKRFEGFPVRIAYLSRAVKGKKVKELLHELAEGKIDIVIGTHRLVGKDVAFKDLGLLIIDEEQKFGVAVKEKLRRLQVNVDTLTMSATPIPRTLQFSLMGTRDLSNILTPPRNRLPIDTELVRFSDEVIREAVNFELSRQGQVYFIHNRIEDIEEIGERLHRIVPDARIAIGHGQMEPATLETLLLDFSQGEYDILLSTTIISNGIDLPNANTIFIDQAHRFGLSDLHQLRGRVGRSNRKAFCYLLTPPLEFVSETARRRLRTLVAYSELGSGMRIALQDLDIRGAGNVFGREQSGFIADLGFDTYHKVFDEAVREVKRDEFSELFATEKEQLESQVDTLFESDLLLAFPASYVPGDAERIELYRELDNIKEARELIAFKERMRDRFGPIPPEGEGLIAVPQLRVLGSKMRLEKISIRKGQLRLFLPQANDDPFYESDAFGKLLNYVTLHTDHSFIEESKTERRLIRFQGIETVEEAIRLLNFILVLPII